MSAIPLLLTAVLVQPATLCERIDVPGPPARIIHALAWHEATGSVVLQGGDVIRSRPRGDTWLWDGTAWREHEGPGPDARYGHALVPDPARGVLVLAGGYDKQANLFTDHWEWDGDGWARRDVDAPPRRSAAAAFDAASGLVLLQGGNLWRGRGTEDGFAEDTWVYDGTSWRRAATEGPEGRYGAAATTDPATGGVLLFGGNDHSDNVYGDTWRWQDGGWTRISTTGPSPRGGALLIGDARSGVWLLGGFRGDTVHTDAWRWDGEAWHLAREDAIPALIFPAMAWDARRRVAVLVGLAQSGDGEVQTWECRVGGTATPGTAVLGTAVLGTGRFRGTRTDGGT